MKKLLAFALAASLGIVGCNKSAEPIDKQGGELTEVTVKLDGQALTRADGTPENGVLNENDINIVEFYVFNADGQKDPNYHYFVKSSGFNEPAAFLVTEGPDKRFLVAVNQSLGDSGNANYDIWKERIFGTNLSHLNSKTRPIDFAMAGEGTKTVALGHSNTLSITIERVVSKVEAPTVIAGGADVSEIAGNLNYLKEIFGAGNVNAIGDITNLSWDFNGFVLINGIDRSYSFDHGFINWNPSGRMYEKTAYNADGSVIQSVYSGDDPSAVDFFLPANYADPVYMYENNPDENSKLPGEATTFVKDQVTAFLIKGTFACDQFPAGEVRYWRVNLIKDDIWKIYRNSIYRITMENILTPGWKTPKEAEDDGPIVNPTESSITIGLQIAPWNVKLQSVDL